ncbi:E3 ubiquitin-protein ligase TRIM39-like [Protopterus annectens]|uniref:E3 ubiquitin-protein ligase TRIM39-like n=1 Tax=Protopterus annectens TaxID=7888 RepID=UPI001CFAE265|nr:E3 ubiquitin-protein ligase TRIM39-like [Protopterus annectens]
MFLLDRLSQKEKKILETWEEKLRHLSNSNYSISKLIKEMEEKLRSQEVIFFKDIENLFDRSKVIIPIPRMELSRININESISPCYAWMAMMKKFKPAPLTLDPSTAHPRLIVSADRTAVKLSSVQQKLPNNPERFDVCPAVLSCEAFHSGRHCWNVQVEGDRPWAVGVVRESMRRKGGNCLTQSKGCLAVWWWGLNDYLAGDSSLQLTEKLQRITMYLDYERGQLSFYNPDTVSHVYTFKHLFTEKVFPFFYTCSSDPPLQIVSSVMI